MQLHYSLLNFETCGVGLGVAKMVLLTSLVVVTFSVCLSEKLRKIHGCCQIQHNFKCVEYLCKLCTKYLISLTSIFIRFYRQNLETSDIPHVIPLTVAMLSTLKNGLLFLAHRLECDLNSMNEY